MLEGLMMDWPLTLPHFLDRARRICSRRIIAPDPRRHPSLHATGSGPAGSIAWRPRSPRSASSGETGSARWPGIPIATTRRTSRFPAWARCCTPSTSGSFPSSWPRVINHAGDSVILVDASLLPLLQKVRSQLTTVKHVIVMSDVAAGSPPGVLDYETAAGDGAGAFSLARARGARCRGALLHLGHHRQSQGRALLPSVAGSAYAGHLAQRFLSDHRAGCIAGGRADVPRQRVGAPLCRRDDRRGAW